MNYYEVIKYTQDENKRNVTIARNLDEAQAQKLCNDPETSSMTARKPYGCAGDEAQIERWHAKRKHWFYGYRTQ